MLFLTRLLGVFSSIALFITISSKLSVTEFGLFEMVVKNYSFFSLVLLLGLDQKIYITFQKERSVNSLIKYIYSTIVLYIFITLLLLPLFFLLDLKDFYNLILINFVFLFGSINVLVSNFYHCKNKIFIYFIFSNILMNLILILFFFYFSIEFSLSSLLVVLLFFGIFSSLLQIIPLMSNFKLQRNINFVSTFKNNYFGNKNIYISNFLMRIFSMIDFWILYFILNLKYAFGIYAFSLKLLLPLIIVNQFMDSIAIPRFNSLLKNGISALKNEYYNFLKIKFLVCLFIVFFVNTLTIYIVPKYYNDYYESIFLLNILSFGYFFSATIGPVSRILIYAGESKWVVSNLYLFITILIVISTPIGYFFDIKYFTCTITSIIIIKSIRDFLRINQSFN